MPSQRYSRRVRVAEGSERPCHGRGCPMPRPRQDHWRPARTGSHFVPRGEKRRAAAGNHAPVSDHPRVFILASTKKPWGAVQRGPVPRAPYPGMRESILFVSRSACRCPVPGSPVAFGEASRGPSAFSRNARGFSRRKGGVLGCLARRDRAPPVPTALPRSTAIVVSLAGSVASAPSRAPRRRAGMEAAGSGSRVRRWSMTISTAPGLPDPTRG